MLLDGLTIGDDPAAWAAAGFTRDDHGSVQVGQVTLHLVGPDRGRGILGWSFAIAGAPGTGDRPDSDDQTTVDGLPTTVHPRPPGTAGPHPNGVVTVDHVVVFTPDPDRTTMAFGRHGLDVRRIRDTEHDGRPLTQTFYRSGEVVLEQVGPLGPDPAAPATFYGLGFTADLDAAAAHLGEVRDAVQPGRRIATLRHRALGLSVPIVLLSPAPPRAAGGSEVSGA